MNRRKTSRSLGEMKTILLVEDDPRVLELMKQTLELRGYTVLAASSGRQAIDLFSTRANDIRLLICDVVLPEMNGRELADRFREMKRDLQILHISGYSDDILAGHKVLRGEFTFLVPRVNCAKKPQIA